MNLPNDPIMLLSFINTQLRDHYPSLDELVASNNLDKQAILDKLAAVNYSYDANRNQFV